MIYRYIFADGTVSEVEVDDSLGSAIIAMDAAEENNNRRESGGNLKAGWHLRLDAFDFGYDIFADDADTLTDIIERERVSEYRDSLKKAFSTLKPQQRKLLTEIYTQRRKAVDIAREEGLSEASVSQQLRRIYAKIRQEMANDGFTKYERIQSDNRCPMSAKPHTKKTFHGGRLSDAVF